MGSWSWSRFGGRRRACSQRYSSHSQTRGRDDPGSTSRETRDPLSDDDHAPRLQRRALLEAQPVDTCGQSAPRVVQRGPGPQMRPGVQLLRARLPTHSNDPPVTRSCPSCAAQSTRPFGPGIAKSVLQPSACDGGDIPNTSARRTATRATRRSVLRERNCGLYMFSVHPFASDRRTRDRRRSLVKNGATVAGNSCETWYKR